MSSDILKALLVPTVGKFLMKNSGNFAGSRINMLKNSNYQWLKNTGNYAEKALNKASGYVGEGELKKQLNNAIDAAQGKEVKLDLNLNDDKTPTPQQQTQQQNALALPSQPFYDRNLGGSKFTPYIPSRGYVRHSYRRVKIPSTKTRAVPLEQKAFGSHRTKKKKSKSRNLTANK